MPKGTEETILRRKDLCNRYGCSLRTIDDWHASKILPAGRYLPGQCRPFWYLTDIEANESKTPTLRKHWGNNQPKKSAPPVSQFSLKL